MKTNSYKFITIILPLFIAGFCTKATGQSSSGEGGFWQLVEVKYSPPGKVDDPCNFNKFSGGEGSMTYSASAKKGVCHSKYTNYFEATYTWKRPKSILMPNEKYEISISLTRGSMTPGWVHWGCGAVVSIDNPDVGLGARQNGYWIVDLKAGSEEDRKFESQATKIFEVPKNYSNGTFALRCELSNGRRVTGYHYVYEWVPKGAKPKVVNLPPDPTRNKNKKDNQDVVSDKKGPSSVEVAVENCLWKSYTPDQRHYFAQPGGVMPHERVEPGKYLVFVGDAGPNGLNLPPATWTTHGPFDIETNQKWTAFTKRGSRLDMGEDEHGFLNMYTDPDPDAMVYVRNNDPDKWQGVCVWPQEIEEEHEEEVDCDWITYTPDWRAYFAQPGGVLPYPMVTPGKYKLLIGDAGDQGLTIPPPVWRTYGPYNFESSDKYVALLGSGLRLDYFNEADAFLNMYGDPKPNATVYVRNNDSENWLAMCLLKEEVEEVKVDEMDCTWKSYTPDPRQYFAQPGGVFPHERLTPGTYEVLIGRSGKEGLNMPPDQWKTFGPYTLKIGEKWAGIIDQNSNLSIFDKAGGALMMYEDPTPDASVYIRNNDQNSDDHWNAVCIRKVDVDLETEYEVVIDNCHSGIQYEGTDNTITVEFLNDIRIVESISKRRIKDCSTAATFTVTSTEDITGINIKVDGDDAFYIDKIELYKDGELITHHGQNNGMGWCLSTDPGDDRGSWTGMAINDCQASQYFDFYTDSSEPDKLSDCNIIDEILGCWDSVEEPGFYNMLFYMEGETLYASYGPSGNIGSLDNIKVDEQSCEITGEWHITNNTQNGTFTFRVNHDEINGAWQFGDRSGSWKGRRGGDCQYLY